MILWNYYAFLAKCSKCRFWTCAACAVCIQHYSVSWCQVERMRRDEIGDFLEKECLAGESPISCPTEMQSAKHCQMLPNFANCRPMFFFSRAFSPEFSWNFRFGFDKSLVRLSLGLCQVPGRLPMSCWCVAGIGCPRQKAAWGGHGRAFLDHLDHLDSRL